MVITDWIQVVATVVLVGVTIFYAWQARKTVSEMRKQRFDTVRPVIDIEILDMQKQMGAQPLEAPAFVDEDTPYVLSFVLHNIGLGPAIGVSSTTLRG